MALATCHRSNTASCNRVINILVWLGGCSYYEGKAETHLFGKISPKEQPPQATLKENVVTDEERELIRERRIHLRGKGLSEQHIEELLQEAKADEHDTNSKPKNEIL